MLKTLTLDSMRRIAARTLVALMAGGVAVTLAAGIIAGSKQVALATGLAALAAAVPAWNAYRGRFDATARVALGMAVPVTPAAILFALSGHPWQTDIHMLFFALIAALVPLADWRAILAATLVTAVHHLLINFIAPAYVFGGGGSLARVLMHAVIVLIESGVLMWTANALVTLLATSEKALA